MSVVWLFNLDADEELASPAGYRPSARVLQGIAARRETLQPFLREGEDIAPVRGSAPHLRGRTARAWCPTPWARERCRRLGLVLEPGPSLDVLAAVNARSFLSTCAAGAGVDRHLFLLPGAFVIAPGDSWGQARSRDQQATQGAQGRPRASGRPEGEEADGTAHDGAQASRPARAPRRSPPCSRSSSTRERWVLKREHGFAGRGLRVLSTSKDEGSELDEGSDASDVKDVMPRPEADHSLSNRGWTGRGLEAGDPSAPAPILTAADEEWLRRSLARGPVHVEPWVERQLEVVVHGWIDRHDPTGSRTKDSDAGLQDAVAPEPKDLPRAEERAGSAEFSIRLADPLVQECSATGTWLRTRAADPGEIPDEVVRRLQRGAAHVARALFACSYHGPFGLDGFLWGHPGDPPRLTLCDLNARYTMSWWRSRSQLEPAPR